MNIDYDLDLFISVFDLIIVGLLIFAGWKGYKKGAIVSSITLFTFLAGMVFSFILSRTLYNYLSKNSDVPDLFANLVLGMMLVAAIYLSIFVSKKVEDQVKNLPKGTYDKAIGAGLNVAKFIIIIAIYSLMITSIDCHSNFLPKSEKKSKLAKASRVAIMFIFPSIRMEGGCLEEQKTTPVTTKDDKTKVYEPTKDNF